MEISKKEKILNIIFTTVIFVLTVLGFVALFGETNVKTTIVTFGGLSDTVKTGRSVFGESGFIKQVTDFINQITSGSLSGDAIVDSIRSMVSSFIILMAFIVCAIIMTIYLIIIIVRGIQVYCGKRDIKTLFASYLKFALTGLTFVMFVYLVTWTKSSNVEPYFSISETVCLGWGTTMGLISSFVGIALLILGKFLYPSEKKLIVRIFSSLMAAMLAFVVVFVFVDSVKEVSADGSRTYQTTMFEFFRQLASFKNFDNNPLISMQKAVLYLTIAYFGFALAVVGVGTFARSVLSNELGVNDSRFSKLGRTGISATSSMVKSILSLVFTSVGLITCTWMYCKLYSGKYGNGYTVSTMPIIIIVLLGVVLGFAIANKCLDRGVKEETQLEAKEAK